MIFIYKLLIGSIFENNIIYKRITTILIDFNTGKSGKKHKYEDL